MSQTGVQRKQLKCLEKLVDPLIRCIQTLTRNKLSDLVEIKFSSGAEDVLAHAIARLRKEDFALSRSRTV